MSTHRVHRQFNIVGLNDAVVTALFRKLGYNIPTSFTIGLRRTADLEFKKPAPGGMEYHVRVKKEASGFIVDCHFEPSQSLRPLQHAAIDLKSRLTGEEGADYGKGKAQLRFDLLRSGLRWESQYSELGEV